EPGGSLDEPPAQVELFRERQRRIFGLEREDALGPAHEIERLAALGAERETREGVLDPARQVLRRGGRRLAVLVERDGRDRDRLAERQERGAAEPGLPRVIEPGRHDLETFFQGDAERDAGGPGLQREQL